MTTGEICAELLAERDEARTLAAGLYGLASSLRDQLLRTQGMHPAVGGVLEAFERAVENW